MAHTRLHQNWHRFSSNCAGPILTIVFLISLLPQSCIWSGIRDPEWVFTSRQVSFVGGNEKPVESISIPIGNGDDSVEFRARVRFTRKSPDSWDVSCRIVCAISLVPPSKSDIPLLVHLTAIRIEVEGVAAALDPSSYSKPIAKLKRWQEVAYATFAAPLPTKFLENSGNTSSLKIHFDLTKVFEHNGVFMDSQHLEGHLPLHPSFDKGDGG